ncbi:MAG: hypothetical protein ACR2JB_19150 [Bryobacteraceae bacterium]
MKRPEIADDVNRPLAALLILLSIAAIAGLLLSLAIVGLHIQQDLARAARLA